MEEREKKYGELSFKTCTFHNGDEFELTFGMVNKIEECHLQYLHK